MNSRFAKLPDFLEAIGERLRISQVIESQYAARPSEIGKPQGMPAIGNQ